MNCALRRLNADARAVLTRIFDVSRVAETVAAGPLEFFGLVRGMQVARQRERSS